MVVEYVLAKRRNRVAADGTGPKHAAKTNHLND
jgi:hypothetical protein